MVTVLNEAIQHIQTQLFALIDSFDRPNDEQYMGLWVPRTSERISNFQK